MKLISRTIALLLCALAIMPISADAIDVSAKSAILIEAESGDVIFEKNAGERMSMASTTKIMTSLVAIEHGDLSKTVTVADEACGVEGSSIYLKPGEKLTLEELLYAVMLESANDAATAVAYEIASGIEPFADMMNETAAKIGLSDTHFTNPHGLDEDEHYTTAADLAKLAAYALENDQFKTIVSTYKKEIPGVDGVRVLVNHNKLLRLSDDVIGVKTGFTKKSGRCLVSAAENDGVRVIAVTLKAPDDWRDHLNMHELGLNEYTSYHLATPGEFSIEIPCVGARDGVIMLQNGDEFTITMKSGKTVTSQVIADRLIFPPVQVGDVLGEVRFVCDGECIGAVPLYSAADVQCDDSKTPFYEKLIDLFR